ncbi:hypothetical protein [Phaeobacter sp. J2-8]|nr:hypothetical protein [Phaeobacter sp. J2-8]MCJ7873389.1 hypothetical protein [Phaeobacter sp. J2-8]
MTKPKPANSAPSISHPDLASALARIMRETFNGSDASGAWDWRMAYDLM